MSRSSSSEDSRLRIKKGRKRKDTSSSPEGEDFEELQRQYKREEAKREKDRLLLKQRLKEERKNKEQERK